MPLSPRQYNIMLVVCLTLFYALEMWAGPLTHSMSKQQHVDVSVSMVWVMGISENWESQRVMIWE